MTSSTKPLAVCPVVSSSAGWAGWAPGTNINRVSRGTKPAPQARRVTAWDNPTWVLAVMHYPNDPALLDYVRRGNETLPFGGHLAAACRDTGSEAARAGKTAGNVLAILYGISFSPWRIPEAGFGKAVQVAEKLARIDEPSRSRKGRPTGHTQIEKCYDDMRSVAHLWAAVRLHWEYPTRPHEELVSTDDGIRTLLRIARGVQDWAIGFASPRTNDRFKRPLLGDKPWLVPSDILPLYPPWKQRPSWLIDTAKAHKRRPR